MDLQKIVQYGELKKYQADQYIYRQGEPGEKMFIILRGTVCLSATPSGCSTPTSVILKPGDFFGEMSLLEDLPRQADARALEDVLVIAVNKDKLEKLLTEVPGLAMRILRSLSSRLRRAGLASDFGLVEPEDAPQESQSITSQASQSGELKTPLATKADNPLQPSQDYGLVDGPEADKYLFDKEVSCPFCQEKFLAKMLRSSKLKLERIDSDLRKHFQDIDPIWYDIWVCPGCGYANFAGDFLDVKETMKKRILANRENLPQHALRFSNPRRIEEVLSSYHLAIQWLEILGGEPEKLGRAWLRLSWLYQDLNDQEKSDMARRKAFEHFKAAYQDYSGPISVQQEQQLALILGELALRDKNYRDAHKYLRAAIRDQGGNKQLNNMARDRIQDLRQIISASKKENE